MVKFADNLVIKTVVIWALGLLGVVTSLARRISGGFKSHKVHHEAVSDGLVIIHLYAGVMEW